MKINTTKQRQLNRLLYPLIFVVLLIGTLVVATYNFQLWPFSVHTDESKINTDPSVSDAPKDIQREPEDNDNEHTDTKNEPASTNTDYIDTPIYDKPSKNEAYPIENSHYKITQISNERYEITLYPIANNPEYSNYNAQLKAYKDEALSYLEDRYGSVNNFSIMWSPDEAKDV